MFMNEKNVIGFYHAPLEIEKFPERSYKIYKNHTIKKFKEIINKTAAMAKIE